MSVRRRVRSVFADPDSNFGAGDDGHRAGGIVYDGRITLEPACVDARSLVRFGK